MKLDIIGVMLTGKYGLTQYVSEVINQYHGNICCFEKFMLISCTQICLKTLCYLQAGLRMSTAVDVDVKSALATAANEARGLAMDSIAAAHSGHMGLPLGAAEVGATLYGKQVSLL